MSQSGPARGSARPAHEGTAPRPAPDALASAPRTAPVSPADEALVRRLREGDSEAGATLVGRYDSLLLGYLRRLAGSDHLAEELHQATWLSVLENLEKFDPRSAPGGFKAWLFRIATNKANDWWRRSGREQAAKGGLKLVADPYAEAGDTIEAAEQVQQLREAIGRLPEPQREVLLLRYYSGLKFVDIAATLGCPLNTALGRMHKAMNKLKQMMEADGA